MSEFKYLSKINSPADLKKMQEDEIAPLASEIRDFLIDKVTKNGGHLASNLGVVELTIAIHRIFDIPRDHLILDVSHQSYVHKIITERKDMFDTLRKGGGLGGFMKRSESEYDCFGAGHSSTSVSAGLGFAVADKLQGSDATTIVVLGDGAFTGGMIHEALNNIEKDLKLVIILNENEMSISQNNGSFARILTKLRLHPGYVKTKAIVTKIISVIPLIGKPSVKLIRRLKKRIKDIFYGSNYFENLGLFYVGPVDGHNEKQLEDALTIAKNCRQSSIVHVKTVKGKGYEPAEQSPAKYHGIAPADAIPQTTTFSKEFGKYITELAESDDKICAITAAMLDGTGLCDFAKRFPERTFDVGIAEEHAATFACGLAAEGMKPYFAVYSTFLQRSYDNLIHDMALQGLPVKLCIDRAGLNAADGATHHGIYDVSMISQIPNMTLYSPATYETLRRSLIEANETDSPCAIRYAKGEEFQEIVEHFYKSGNSSRLSARADFEQSERLDAIIITHGCIARYAIKAKALLAAEGISVGIILVEKIMPYCDLTDNLLKLIPTTPCNVITLEEEIRAGGFGMTLCDKLSRHKLMKNKNFSIMALEGTFADRYGDDIYKTFELDEIAIIKRIKEMQGGTI